MKLTIMYCILTSIILTSHGYTTQSYSQTPLYLNLTTCSFYSRINGTTAYCLHLINSTIRFAKNVEETSCLSYLLWRWEEILSRISTHGTNRAFDSTAVERSSNEAW